MYRSRLGTDLSKITLDYVSSENEDSQITLYDILGSQAHTLMLYENKIITKNDVAANEEDEDNDHYDFNHSDFA